MRSSKLHLPPFVAQICVFNNGYNPTMQSGDILGHEFIRLHRATSNHFGIIVCTNDLIELVWQPGLMQRSRLRNCYRGN